MHPFRLRLAPAGRLLSHHLGRLRQALETLAAHVRDAVASAVAGAVHEAVHELLGEPAERPYPHGARARPLGREDPFWHEPGGWPDDPWFDDPAEVPPEYAGDEQESESPEGTDPGTDRSMRWSQAAATGLQAAAWWLRRGGRFRLLTAVGVGLAAALAAYAGGPLAVAGVGLAGSALGLLSATEGTSPDARIGSRFDTP